MTQAEKRIYLINYLKSEDKRLDTLEIPAGSKEQDRLLRSLMNIRPPKPFSKEFEKLQNEYLQEKLKEKGIVRVNELQPVKPGIYLWQGDITRLAADAIVNAANSAMLGCFVPCHGCIDNAIHSAAGLQLRNECNSIMEKQQAPEQTGTAKVTKAYNLPCQYVIHTVGPIISGKLTDNDMRLLSDCYRSCLEAAAELGLKSIAFCCISTGEFRFPNVEAAEIAVNTVSEFKELNNSDIEVIFNVFKDKDYEIYSRLLG